MVNSNNYLLHEPIGRTGEVGGRKAGGPDQLVDSSDVDEPPICGSRLRTQQPEHGVMRGNLGAPKWMALIILMMGYFTTATAASIGSTPVVATPFGPPTLVRRQSESSAAASTCACSSGKEAHNATFAVEAAMIPLLVLLSGAFAGLTLGYMSLDATQLSVLAKSGSEKQRRLASKIAPLRKDGHLLLITLLIANMICNEILPVVSDPVLGGGVQAVIVSTVLIVIFSEIIPQSVCSRFGLQIGAACTWPVQGLVYLFYPISWPIARMLTKILGAHSGVIYRRAELKELVNLHGIASSHGGDLNKDVVTIVGATLDLQEKRVRDAMTPMSKCFMLDVKSRLDYETLGKVLQSGHSRIPVYELVGDAEKGGKRKILGVLLTKNLILIDPEDGVPLRDFPLHPLPLVADTMPLLNILNSFQEGRSHMAIVCPRKPGFFPTHRTTFAGDTSAESPASGTVAGSGPSSEASGDEGESKHRISRIFKRTRSNSGGKSLTSSKSRKSLKEKDSEKGEMEDVDEDELGNGKDYNVPLEEDMPMGIISLEDVLEELLGEEIYDETDRDAFGNVAVRPYLPAEAVEAISTSRSRIPVVQQPPKAKSTPTSTPMSGNPTSPQLGGKAGGVKLPFKLGGISRSMSAPGKSRAGSTASGTATPKHPGEHTSPPPAPSTGAAAPAIAVRDYGGADSSSAADIAVLGQISEKPSSVAESEAQTGERGRADLKQGIDAPAPERSASSTPSSVRPVPPLLSDAIMLERGRRALLRQGIDPKVHSLRLAQPQSVRTPGVPADGSTPVLELPVGPGSPGTSGPKGAFKLPGRQLSIPTRTGTPKSSASTALSSNMPRSSEESRATLAPDEDRVPTPLLDSPQAMDERQSTAADLEQKE